MNSSENRKMTMMLLAFQRLNNDRYWMLLILVVIAVGLTVKPIIVAEVPVRVSEAFLLCIFVRASSLESLTATLIYAVLALAILPPSTEHYLILLGVTIELLVVRFFIARANYAAATQSILWAYAAVLLVFACFYQLQNSNYELTKILLAGKILEAIICILIFQCIDKAMIYLNSIFERKLSLFPSQIGIKEYVQGLVASAFTLLILSAIILELVHQKRDLVAVAKLHIADSVSSYGEVQKKKTIEKIVGNKLDEFTTPRYSSERENSIPDPTLAGLKVLRINESGLEFQDEFPQLMREPARLISLLEPRAFTVVSPEFSGDDFWRLIARFGVDRVAVYTFESSEAMESHFSSEVVTVELVEISSGFQETNQYELPSAHEKGDAQRHNFYHDDSMAIWALAPAGYLRNPSMATLANPKNTFLTYKIESSLRMTNYHWAFATTISAWPFVVVTHADFTNMSILGFSILFIAINLFGFLVKETLEPIRLYSSDVKASVRAIAQKAEGSLTIPEVKRSLITEANESQESFNYLFKSLYELGRENEDAIRAYQHLTSSMPLGVMAVDKEDNTVFVNEGLAEICKLSVTALGEIKEKSKPLKIHKDGDKKMNISVIAGDGSDRQLAVTKVNRLGNGGIDDGYWAIAVDLTEEKIKDAQLAQASKLATLGQMSTEIAHELNQPLNVLAICRSHISIAFSQPELDREKVLEKLKRMKMSIDRASRIINHMRTYGRVDTENFELSDAREAIRGALTLTADQLKLLGVEVLVEMPNEPLKVMIDLTKVEQVLLNLISNARDAVLENADVPRIIINAEALNGIVTIRVLDNGGGVSPGDLFKIFEPFWTTKLAGEGTGLGGSISYGIIKDMGGKIFADNVPGGLQVTIQLREHGGELEVSKSSRSTA